MTDTQAPSVRHQIGIIGTGSTGSALAFSLLLRNVCHEILLADLNESFCDAQVSDLTDAQFLSHTKIRKGTRPEIGQCDIAVITAGARQKPGQTRLELIDENIEVLKTVLTAMQPLRKDIILVVITNPVDVLTWFAYRLSGLPSSQVIGSGTFLDTVRLRNALAEERHIPHPSISAASVYGEHGDSSFISWAIQEATSTLAVTIHPDLRKKLTNHTRAKANTIIQGKGSTCFGVAATTTSICESILNDRRDVQAVSTWHEEFGCAISLPHILGRRGAEKVTEHGLGEEEMGYLRISVEVVRGCVGGRDVGIVEIEEL